MSISKKNHFKLGLSTLTALCFSVFVWAVPVSPHSPDAAKADSYRDQGDSLDPEILVQGEAVYNGLCINCHEHGLNRAPQRFTLSFMTPESILKAMTSGVMQMQTSHLSLENKEAVAQYLTSRQLGESDGASTLRCNENNRAISLAKAPVLDGWGFDAGNSHAIPDTYAGINRKNVGSLKVKWVMAYPGAVRARSQPLVVGDTLFVGSQSGTVYALDLESGCARWTFEASAEIKVGILIEPWDTSDDAADPLVFFGDLIGNQYGVKARTGELVWQQKMDAHPSTTLSGTSVLVDDILLVPTSSLEEGAASDPTYPCCTFRGSLVALDAKTGKEKYRTTFIPESIERGVNASGARQFGPSGVPLWTVPVVDEVRGQVYVASGDNYSSPATANSDSVMAIGLDKGGVRWVYQATADDAWNGSCDEKIQHNCPEEDGPDVDFGSSPVLAKGADGKDYVLAADKAGEVFAIDPESGDLRWKKRVGRGGVVGGILFGMAAKDGVLYVPVTDVPDGRTYDIPPQPGLYALDIATGEYVWRAPSEDTPCNGRTACYPGYQTVPSVTSELVFAGSNDGYLRAYDRLTGEVLWQADTAREFETVSGEIARGGSIGGSASPLAVRGKLITNSGYAFAGKMAGGVLIVYEVE